MGWSRTVTTGLVQACHPGPTAVVTALSAALLIGIGARPATAALATSAVLTGQLSVGWSNDWIDAVRDVSVGRRDKPVVRGLVGRQHLGAAALTAVALCVVLSLATGWLPGAVHLVAVGAAWSYNARLKSTVWSPVPYAVSFGLLPMFLVLTLPGSPAAPAWVVAGGALLGVGAHLANVLPDLDDDAVTGVRGLPHRLGRRGTSALAPVVLLAAALVVVLGPRGPVGAVRTAVLVVAAVLAVSAGVVALLRHRSRAPFRLTMAVAAACVVLLLAAGPELAGEG